MGDISRQNTKEAAKKLCEQIQANRVILDTEQRQRHMLQANKINAVLNIIRKDKLSHCLLQAKGHPLPAGVSLRNASNSSTWKEPPSWKTLYPYPTTNLSEGRELTCYDMSTKRNEGPRHQKRTSKSERSTVHTTSKASGQESKFPNPYRFADRSLSIDALKQEALEYPWMRYSYFLRIAQRYTELDDLGRATKYYLLSIEEHPDFETQFKLLEKEGENNSSNWENTLETGTFRKKMELSQKLKADKKPLALRDKAWLQNFNKFTHERSKVVLKRHCIAHHGCMELFLRQFYESQTNHFSDHATQAAKHLRAWLSLQRASSRPAPFGERGDTNRSIHGNSVDKRNTCGPKRKDSSATLLVLALVEVHDSIRKLRETMGPLEPEDQGRVASTGSVGPIGNVHIDVLRELIAILDGKLSNASLWKLKKGECGEPLVLLDALEPSKSVRHHCCKYSAIDLWFQLGELFTERLEYTNAQAMFARVAHHQGSQDKYKNYPGPGLQRFNHEYCSPPPGINSDDKDSNPTSGLNSDDKDSNPPPGINSDDKDSNPPPGLNSDDKDSNPTSGLNSNDKHSSPPPGITTNDKHNSPSTTTKPESKCTFDKNVQYHRKANEKYEMKETQELVPSRKQVGSFETNLPSPQKRDVVPLRQSNKPWFAGPDRFQNYVKNRIPTSCFRSAHRREPVYSLHDRVRHLHAPCATNVVPTAVSGDETCAPQLQPSTQWGELGGKRDRWFEQTESMAQTSLVPLQVPARLCAKLQLVAAGSAARKALESRAVPFAPRPLERHWAGAPRLGTNCARYHEGDLSNVRRLWLNPLPPTCDDPARARVGELAEPAQWELQAEGGKVHRANLHVSSEREQQEYHRGQEQKGMMEAELESLQAHNLRCIRDNVETCDHANHNTTLLANVVAHAPPFDLPSGTGERQSRNRNAFTIQAMSFVSDGRRVRNEARFDHYSSVLKGLSNCKM